MKIVDEELQDVLYRVNAAKAELAAAHAAHSDAQLRRNRAECALANAKNALGKLLQERDVIGGDYKRVKNG